MRLQVACATILFICVSLHRKAIPFFFFRKNDNKSCLGNSFYFLQTDYPEPVKVQQATTHNKNFQKRTF